MILDLLDRRKPLFETDFKQFLNEMQEKAVKSSFLVVGGAGSIGSAVVKALVSLGAKKVQIVDISENNLVELIRDIRSSKESITTEIETFALDCGSQEFQKFFDDQVTIDYLLNFSALKHVRSERDIYTLIRLIDVNVINSLNLLKLAEKKRCKKYFCISTDKAANPVNMMGASKLLMEKFIFSQSVKLSVSAARFANVAFSDGSLLFGFEHRLNKKQPLAIPTDIRRFFVTPEEAAQLCMLACLVTKDKQILFPKAGENFTDIRLVDIAKRYLYLKGFTPMPFDNESEAKRAVDTASAEGRWPCFYFESDTTGEKQFEEFYSDNENVNLDVFSDLGVVNYAESNTPIPYEDFISKLNKFKLRKCWSKNELINLFKEILPSFNHEEKHKNLDQKM
jgi:FlaA1/EpsC-like NDP-sugar epimerase